MAKIRFIATIEYDADIMYGSDEEAKRWFFDDVLREGGRKGELILHTNGDLGDDIGTLRIDGKIEEDFVVQSTEQ